MVQNGFHIIENKQVKGTGKQFKSINPATGNPIWVGASARTDEVVYAIKSGVEALENWKKLKYDQRVEIIHKFLGVLEKKKDLLAKTISNEVGKPLWETQLEVGAMKSKVESSLKAFQDRCRTIMFEKNGKQFETIHKPHGLVAIISPFNFPAHLPNAHIIPALLAGNTCLLKPSEKAPYTGQVLTEIWKESGLPPGVLNLVQGGKKVVECLAIHPDVKGLFFTGSYNVGQKLSAIFGKYPEKILALEMGGNNAMLVTKVKDTLAAAFTINQSAFITTGQRCTCLRRLILLETKENKELLKKTIEMASKLKIGPYTADPFMGPVITEGVRNELLESQEKTENMGGEVLLRMKKIQGEGYFVSPAILDVTRVSIQTDCERFGPYLQVQFVSSFEEGVKEVNRSMYGLSSALLSDNKKEYDQFLTQVNAGIINWNSTTTGSSGDQPFGGVGFSGNHRPSGYYAADYCAYPVATQQGATITLPENLPPGLFLS